MIPQSSLDYNLSTDKGMGDQDSAQSQSANPTMDGAHAHNDYWKRIEALEAKVAQLMGDEANEQEPADETGMGAAHFPMSSPAKPPMPAQPKRGPLYGG